MLPNRSFAIALPENQQLGGHSLSHDRERVEQERIILRVGEAPGGDNSRPNGAPSRHGVDRLGR